MIRAEAMPIIAMAAGVKSWHGDAEGESPIPQQREVEAVAPEGHEDRSSAAAIHRKAFDEAEQQFWLGLLPDRATANLVTVQGPPPSSRLA